MSKKQEQTRFFILKYRNLKWNCTKVVLRVEVYFRQIIIYNNCNNIDFQDGMQRRLHHFQWHVSLQKVRPFL